MTPVRRVESRTVVLPVDNIDTDQIIPARFLTTTTRAGLGRHAFNDWRWLADGSPNPEFVFNRPESRGASILVAGRNVGCGSSREHAPWALLDAGIEAVVSSSIADIFRSNALKNGLLALVVDDDAHAELLANPGERLSIDVAASRITCADGRNLSFTIDPFARQCLLEGVDELGYLLQRLPLIERFEART
ncbi:MAG: 3-isopropylmalate dehydratase small subunit [Pseudomonadota bacterium]